MSDDYILKYTNGYANYGKIDSDELKVEGDCKITNYDPRNDDGKSKGEITIDLANGEQIIKVGNNSGYNETKDANFSKKKFSIFKEIESLDEKEGLSVKDIRKIDKSYIEKWGLKDLRVDYKYGVVTLIWGENDILRIDFETTREKFNHFFNNIGVKQKENENYQKIYTVIPGDNLEKIAHEHNLYTWELTNANKGIENKKYLQPGDTLIIPDPTPLKTLDDLSQTGKEFLSQLRDLESKGKGGYKAENWAGYLGAYQMGKKALSDLGIYYEEKEEYINDKKNKKWKGDFIKNNPYNITSVQDFLNSKEKQDKAIIRYMQLTWSYIVQNNLDKFVGNDSITNVKITPLGLIAACHLVGRDDVKTYLESNGKIIPKDGNGKPITYYLCDERLQGKNNDFKFN